MMSEGGAGHPTCSEHRATTAEVKKTRRDAKKILRGVAEINLRLERGEGKFDLLNQRMEHNEQSLRGHLEKHEQYASKIIIGLLLAALVAFGAVVANGKFADSAQADTNKPWGK